MNPNPNAAARPPHSAFADRACEPSPASVRGVLGRASAAWDDLEAHLSTTYRLKASLHFMYGPKYGWALRFRQGDRLVAATYPNQGHFTLQVILGRAQVDAAFAMALPPSVSKALEAAKPYPEGRWLFMPVRSVKGARGLRELIALKVAGLRRTRAATPAPGRAGRARHGSPP
jgi:hypothetical protein